MAYPYTYSPYQPGYSGGYMPPLPDQLAQLRQNVMQGQMMQQPSPQPAQPMQPQQPASSGIIWVQGEEGAKAYMVAPGNSVLLMDSENSAFYIKSTDASGMPMPLRAFDYAERTAAPKTPQNAPQIPAVEYVPRQEYDALMAHVNELEARVEALAAEKPARPANKTVKEEAENG